MVVRPPGGARRGVRACGLTVIIAITVGCASSTADPVHRVNEPLPVLTGMDLQGRPLSTRDRAGSVLVINAWSVTCTYCEEETPMLVGLSKRYASQGVRFLGIDHVDPIGEAKRFVQRYDVPYPSFADQAGRFAAVLGYPGLPATYVVDAAGTIRFAIIGPSTEAMLVPLIDEVLGEVTPTPSAAA